MERWVEEEKERVRGVEINFLVFPGFIEIGHVEDIGPALREPWWG